MVVDANCLVYAESGVVSDAVAGGLVPLRSTVPNNLMLRMIEPSPAGRIGNTNRSGMWPTHVYACMYRMRHFVMVGVLWHVLKARLLDLHNPT
jgi:hypothetical protein